MFGAEIVDRNLLPCLQMIILFGKSLDLYQI
jgi:hypothetical protein